MFFEIESLLSLNDSELLDDEGPEAIIFSRVLLTLLLFQPLHLLDVRVERLYRGLAEVAWPPNLVDLYIFSVGLLT